MRTLRFVLGGICLLLAGCTVPSRLAAGGPAAAGTPDLVVLVHGLGQTPYSMIPMERHLTRAGYRVLSFGYSSVGLDVPTIGHRLAEATEAALAEVPAGHVHFVGHSLGGIAIRWMLAHERPDHVGRVVLLASPNQGAASADWGAPLFGWILRPLYDLQTAEGSTVRTLPSDPGVPMLIIAGSNDHKVSAAEAHLDGAEVQIVVPSGHTTILMRPSVMRLVERYLAGGVPALQTPASSTAAPHAN